MNRRFPASRGFTLIEAALVTILVGVGAVAMLQLLAAGTMANRESAELSTAVQLARNVRELCLTLSFSDPLEPMHWGRESGESLSSLGTLDDLDDLTGARFDPPVDATGATIPDLQGWEQRVQLVTVDPVRPRRELPNGSAPGLRLVVTVSHGGREIETLTWCAYDTRP